MSNEILCPLFSDGNGDVECSGDMCAWWNDTGENCWVVQGAVNIWSLRRSVQDLVVAFGGTIGGSSDSTQTTPAPRAVRSNPNRSYKSR